jgi:hypothetical protein
MLAKVSKKGVLVCSSVAAVLFLYSLNQTPKENDENLIYILFYNSYLDSFDTWGMKKNTSTTKDLKRINCPLTNCIFTNNKNLLKEITQFDVLFFNNHHDITFPMLRNPEQYYVMGTVE